MMKKFTIPVIVLGCLLAQFAMADVANKKTKVTFSGPVQVPGATLPAGTYVFKLADSASNRNIVQVTNTRGNQLYATIMAIPDYRLNATSKTVMYFTERAKNSPVAIKSWFYPGDNYGNRFVYPKVKAQEIAVAAAQPVPSTTVQVTEKVKIVEVPVYIQTPAKQEVPYQVAQVEKHDATDTAGVDGEAVPEEAPAAAAPPAAQLPKTASPIHMIAGLGALLLGVSALTRSLGNRVR
jgi:hypothetical protein